MKSLYFDYNASAPLASGLIDQLPQWLAIEQANPSSVHRLGQKRRVLIEKARRSSLKLLNALGCADLIFTSGGTESNNTVLWSAFLNRGQKNKIIASAVEHACVYETLKYFEQQGVTVIWIKPSQKGEINLADFQQALDESVFLVACILANNETGFIFPIQKMCELAKEKNIPFFTDAVCAVGKCPVDFAVLNVDYLTFSSHKFGGLQGVGGIVVHKNAKLNPLLRGGGQELEKRSGTENFLGILSSEFALRQSLQEFDQERQRQSDLRSFLITEVQKRFANTLVLQAKENLSQTATIVFKGFAGQVLLTNLDLENVAASYGSACASGSLEVSRVLLAVCENPEDAASAIRFSFGRETSLQDIKELLDRIEKVIQRMV